MAEDEEGVVLMETLVEDVAWVNVAPEDGYVNVFLIRVFQIRSNLLSHDEKIYAREIL